MTSRVSLIGWSLLCLLATGCAPSWSPPTGTSPTPGYVPEGASADEVWNAAVDFLVDTGTEWEFISNDMRTARINSLITRGPRVEGRQVVPNEEATQFADCGRRNDSPAAGYGDLWAAIAIRVRRTADGAGLLKVVVPRMWITVAGSENRDCVSRGALEERIRTGIRERITPTIGRQS